jgi:polyferredoxin
MSLIEIQWKPADRQVRQFAAICCVGLPFIGWWWEASTTWIFGLGIFGTVLMAISWLQPQFVKPLFVACTLITAPIGLVVGELAIFLIYATVLCPLGILFRIIGRDALQRSIDRDRASYWQEKRQPKSVASYYRQS